MEGIDGKSRRDPIVIARSRILPYLDIIIQLCCNTSDGGNVSGQPATVYQTPGVDTRDTRYSCSLRKTRHVLVTYCTECSAVRISTLVLSYCRTHSSVLHSVDSVTPEMTHNLVCLSLFSFVRLRPDKGRDGVGLTLARKAMIPIDIIEAR